MKQVELFKMLVDELEKQDILPEKFRDKAKDTEYIADYKDTYLKYVYSSPIETVNFNPNKSKIVTTTQVIPNTMTIINVLVLSNDNPVLVGVFESDKYDKDTYDLMKEMAREIETIGNKILSNTNS